MFCTFSTWQGTAKCSLNSFYDLYPYQQLMWINLNSYQHLALSVVDLIFLPIWWVWHSILIILMCVNIFPHNHVNWNFEFPFLIFVHILSPFNYMIVFLAYIGVLKIFLILIPCDIYFKYLPLVYGLPLHFLYVIFNA